MKKITLSLFALLGFSGTFFGQAVISVEAPPYDETGGSWAAPCAPSGTASAAYHRACFYISQAELSRLVQTNSVITSFGFDVFRPASVATAGQFTLMLENTTDASYNKSLTYSTAINGMSTAYTGNLIVPGPASAASPTSAVSVNLTAPFTYSGNAMYVAWEWYGAAANATVFARFLANAALPAASAGGYASAPTSGPAPTVLTPYQFRPCMRFSAGNTATNEIGVIRVTSPGSVPKITGAPYVITAQVRNNGTSAAANIPVTLSVSGSNVYTETQTVTSIAAGAIATVSFTAFNPTVNGTNTMVVTVPADQYTVNNSTWPWFESVNCSDYGNSPAFAAPDYNDGAYGYGGPAAIVTKLTPPTDATITAIKFVVASGAANVGMRGVLLDATGTMIAATRSTNVNGPAAASGQVYTTFRFDTAQYLSANTLYYFGMEQLNSGFPFAISEAINLRVFPNQYFNAPAGGGGIGGVQNQMSYMGMQAVLNFSNTFISADASHTILCNNRAIPVGERETTTLTATGAPGQTYAWSPGIPTSSNGISIIVSPSVNAVQGLINYSVTATDVASGCKSNIAVVSVSLTNCTGIPDNTGFGTSIVVYPNPVVNNKTTVKGLEGKNTITVFNVLGQSVLNFSTTEEEAEVDLNNQAAGNYMVKITNASNQSRIVKVIKN